MTHVSPKPAVLVIDMINEYLSPGGKLVCEPCRNIIPTVQRLLISARERNWPVIYVSTLLQSGEEPLARKWGLHAQPGSWGADTIDELRPQPGDIMVPKTTYDGFYGTSLEDELRRLHVSHILIAGIHTHVCVLLTALGAFYRGFDVTVVEDCITTEKQSSHESRLPFFNSHIGRLLPLDKALLQPAMF